MPGAPQRATRASFLAGTVCAAFAGPRVARAAAASPYRDVIDRYSAAGHYDGVMLVAHGDRVVYKGAAGLADRDHRTPHVAGETFRIASVTKQFTALLAMQEVERGTLELDAPLSRYLLQIPPEVGTITTRQLLKSISGLPNLDSIPNAYTRADVAVDDLPAYVQSLPLTPLVSSPGAKFTYNNLDFLMVGAILQRVTVKPFRALLHERIIDKLGLRSTGLYAATVPVRDVKGYENNDSRLVPEKIGRLENFGPAGAMYSTLDDLLLWDRALLRNTLLGSAATEQMFTPDKAFGYVALGSWVYDMAIPGLAERVHLVERQGNIGGIQVLNVFSPQDDVILIVMANTDFADLFNLYSRKGLPYEVLSLAVADARRGEG